MNPVNFTINRASLAVSEVNGNKDVFVVYPNPSKGILNIRFAQSNEVYDIAVYDVSGRLVFSRQDNKPAHDKTGTFNLADLINGDYMVKIKSKNIDKTVKWIKE
ncbi:MAG TPA: hypothetical protein DCQ68_10850 [Chryseobacterium indologenes]|nr:hypothetical protein [Chryseobacterium indologenes]